MSEKPEIPAESDNELYQVVAARRVSYDNMMWQAPFLSLTAQAFLLTIALSAETKPAGRAISATLGVLASLASIQLMLKHRCNEVADSKWLQAYEEKHSKCRPVHAHLRSFATLNLFTRIPSACVWIAALAAFGLASSVTLLITWLCPEWLSGTP